MTSETEETYRLPPGVEPINYTLTLKPNLVDFVFDGEVTIDIEINKETDKILINSIELKFDKAIFRNNEKTLESESISFCEKSEIATIKFNETLRIGTGKLEIKYTGILNGKMKGFYRSKYIGPNGEQKYGAVSDFEAIDARRALPCWDEPARKATFDVRLIADANKTALSNMPIIEVQDVDGDGSLKKFIFDRSPKMSTYIASFIVGEYDYVEGRDKNGVLIRVYTPVGKKECGQYALDIALKTLPFYTEYFSIGYPLPKLDLVAIGELGPGAMENWGLITYREECLLVDPQNSSIHTKRGVAVTVGHEIAHQWFGNLVTMDWWTDLWLNEGFASWIEYLCVDHCAPEFNIWTHFVACDYYSALDLDGLKTSHPIEVPVKAPSEIDEIFDSITYQKGSSTIRMLHDYIGDDAFRKGLNSYLIKYKYSNAITNNLWDHLGQASQKPVHELMQMWTKQTGYPVITVTKSINSKNEVILKLAQRRFFINGQLPDESENYLWKVPVKIITKSSNPNVHKEFLFEKREEEINLGNIPSSDWIKLNKNCIGLFRTNYSTDMLSLLAEAVKNKSLHATDRIGLHDDAFSLAQAGLLSTVDALRFIESYVEEDEYSVWAGLLRNLGVLFGLLLHTDFYDKFARYLRRLLKSISGKLGWEPKDGESDLQGLCREKVLEFLALIGDEETIKESKKRFEDHMNGKQIPADLRRAVYISVLQNADEALVLKFIQLHDACDLQEEKLRMACALATVKDKNLIEKVLQFAISDSVRTQDSICVVEAVAYNITSPHSLEIGWSFVKKNWNVFSARYFTGFIIMDLVKCVTAGFASLERHDDVKDFFDKNPTPGANRTIQQSLENILKNKSWLERDQESLKKYLSSF